MEPLTTARAVLRSQHVDVDALAQLVASYALSKPSWCKVAPPKSVGITEDFWTEADALRALKWLQPRHPEPLQDYYGQPDRSIMDNAARRGYLSVVRFLHEHRTEGCSTNSMDKAAKYGHFEVVRFLHEHRSEGCSYRAIDEAAGNGHLEIVRYLFEQVRAPFWTEYALQWAASGGHLDVLKYFHEHVPTANDKWSKRTIQSAAANGHVDTVKWLLEHRTEGSPTDAAECGTSAVIKCLLQTTDVETTDNMMTAAVWGEDLELVRYLHEQRGLRCTASAVNYATKLGSLELVRYLHEHLSEDLVTTVTDEEDEWLSRRCLSLGVQYGSQGERSTTKAIDIAAAENQLEIVEYLHEHGYDATALAMDEAAARGRLDIVRFLHEHRSEGCTTYAMDEAAKNHHLDVVKYLHEHRTEGCTSAAIDLAFEDLTTLRFLHENRTEHCSDALVRNIVSSNHVPTLEYVHQQNVAEIPESMLILAAQYGSRDTLAYLYEHCLSDEIIAKPQLVLAAIEKAASNAHIHVLEYFDAMKKADPTHVYTTKAIDEAAERGDISTLKYLHFQGIGGCTADAMDKAAANGHLMVVRFLHDHRSEGCTTEAIDQAAANGHVDVVKFLLEHRSEGYTYKAIDMAKKKKHMEVVALLPDYRVPWTYPGGGPRQSRRR